MIFIQEILEHKSSKTTEVYTHVSRGNIAKIESPLDKIWTSRVGGKRTNGA
jgi:site-specific recombinase XerC